MGCDIHAAVFAKAPDGYGPLYICAFDEPRWYALFGAMAGVRSLEYDFIPPRGLPDYATKDKYCPMCYRYPKDGEQAWWFGDHSFSWLTTAEYRKACEQVSADGSELGTYGGILALMEAMDKQGYECTIVFGFDS